MHYEFDEADYEPRFRRGVVLASVCAGVLFTGFIWSNLLSGDHPAFDRVANAVSPVVEFSRPEVEPARVTSHTAGKTNNAFPSASVSVNVGGDSAADNGELDPLARLIMQTSDQPLPENDIQSSTTPEASLVMLAQKELKALGLYNGVVDGLSGIETRDAVKQYQALNGMPVTGAVTQPVLDHIQLSAHMQDAGKTSVDMHLVQHALTKLGYAPGQIDGKDREQTRDAIREFEQDRGWPVTGKLSEALLLELSSVAPPESMASR